MNQPLALSYGQQLTGLADAMATQWQWPSPESAFTLYAFQAARIELPFDVASTTFSDSHRRRLVEAPVLAAAGYMLAECAADLELQAEWVAGLGRLTTASSAIRDMDDRLDRARSTRSPAARSADGPPRDRCARAACRDRPGPTTPAHSSSPQRFARHASWLRGSLLSKRVT